MSDEVKPPTVDVQNPKWDRNPHRDSDVLLSFAHNKEPFGFVRVTQYAMKHGHTDTFLDGCFGELVFKTHFPPPSEGDGPTPEQHLQQLEATLLAALEYVRLAMRTPWPADAGLPPKAAEEIGTPYGGPMDEGQKRLLRASRSRAVKELTRCAAGRDGDCIHAQCPQLRDGEPERSGRHCPLDTGDDGL